MPQISNPPMFLLPLSSILSTTVIAWENTDFDCAFVCVCMASLRMKLSSTKICHNSLKTYSLVYLSLLLDSWFDQILNVKTSNWPFFARHSTEFIGTSKRVCVPITAPGLWRHSKTTKQTRNTKAHDDDSPARQMNFTQTSTCLLICQENDFSHSDPKARTTNSQINMRNQKHGIGRRHRVKDHTKPLRLSCGERFKRET